MDILPAGLCGCGCGAQPPGNNRYLTGHHRRKSFTRYVEQDTGYPTACWIWQGSTGERYGEIRRNGRLHRAHVVYWEEANGPKPLGTELDHLCRQLLCVRPDHLEPVSHALNVQRGALAKIDFSVAREIRRRYAGGELNQYELANVYGLSQTQVGRIVRNESWVE